MYLLILAWIREASQLDRSPCEAAQPEPSQGCAVGRHTELSWLPLRLLLDRRRLLP
jgi:hypothetical protein